MRNNEIRELDGGSVDVNPARAKRFRTLIVYLADNVGRQHVPVCDHARDIHDLLGADAVHHELIKRLVRQVYKANRCGHLDATVTAEATFAALGEAKRELTTCQFTDIDQINLVDSIGDAVKDWFRPFDQKHDHARDGSELAEVIPLSGTG